LEVAVPLGKRTRNMIEGASGKPNVRVVLVDGVEVHRCSLKPRTQRRRP
jgi:hypothetical protein